MSPEGFLFANILFSSCKQMYYLFQSDHYINIYSIPIICKALYNVQDVNINNTSKQVPVNKVEGWLYVDKLHRAIRGSGSSI